ncbi:MAG: ATP-binding protein [Planctomycetaceae bacterium]|nr:ATP-binding protein [Planctomycetaceae bacterium]
MDTLENKIQFLETQLAHAQRMAVLGELTSTATHEFNNILTTILNYAQLGLRHKDEATRDKAFDKILGAANRAAKITSTILGAAKNRKNTLEPTDLTKLVEETLFLLDREMSKYRIAVEREFQPVPEILAEGNQIQQVLLNLLINARQAMSDGGKIHIKISQDKEQKTVDLMIRDYGCGIPADKLALIFEPYYSTKNGPDASGQGGTGLGLAACQKIIEQHNARIRVESSLGKGTAFTLKFPVITQTPPAKKTKNSPNSTETNLAPLSSSVYS